MDVFVVMVADACLLYLILDTGGNFAVGFRSQPSFVDSQQRKYLGIGQGGWVMRDTRCPETAGGCNVAAVVFGVLVDSKVGSDDADGRLLCPVGTACRGQWFEEGTGVVNNGIEAVELGGDLWPQPALPVGNAQIVEITCQWIEWPTLIDSTLVRVAGGSGGLLIG